MRPSYLVDALRSAAGGNGAFENATDLLIDAATGCGSTTKSAAATMEGRVPDLVRSAAPAARPRARHHGARGGGAPRLERVAALLPPDADGRPAGAFGMLSPGDRPIQRGDPFTVAFGIWGALNCRAGFVGRVGRPTAARDRRLRGAPGGPLLRRGGRVVRGAAHGQTGATLHDIVARRLGDPFFGIFLNPGTRSTWTSG